MTAALPPILTGALRELPLADVLQLLELGRRTGVLRVRVPGQRAGALWLTEGAVADACLVAAGAGEPTPDPRRSDAEVRDVACALLDLRVGSFTFAPAEVLPLAPRFGIEALLVDAARRADEWARLAAWVGGPSAVPTLIVDEAPADTSSGAPTPRQWTLLAEVDGARDVAALAAAVGRDALAVAVDCAALVRAGLLRCDVDAPAERPARAVTRARSSPV